MDRLPAPEPGVAPILFTLQRKCGIGVPPMEKTNMAGTVMPLK